MITQADVASLVPDVYAEYRQVVADGVMFFLEHLSAPRLQAILAEQAALPADADPAQRLVHLLHDCPALHKLGQVVARRRELDPGFRQRLQRLESMRPRTDLSVVRPMVLCELGPSIRRYRMEIDQAAVAEASVAIVIPFTWCDPGAEGDEPGVARANGAPSGAELARGQSERPAAKGKFRPGEEPPVVPPYEGDKVSRFSMPPNAPTAGAGREEGVLKVLRPTAAEYLHEDLDILGRLADFVDQRRGAYGLPPVEYREVFDEVRTILIHEIQVKNEQAHLAAAAARHAGRRDIWVPAIYPFSTPRLTAMQRIRGPKVTDTAGVPADVRRRLARTITRALVAEAVFSRDERVIFHGDPHAGNLVAAPDGRLGVLDWSLTGELTSNDRVQISRILVGALCGDGVRICEAIARLASEPPRHNAVRSAVDGAAAELRGRVRPTLGWLMRLLDGAARAGVRFRTDLLLFRKAFFTLEGVVADLCPERSMEDFVVGVMVEELTDEWPTRWLRPPWSRDYATHISNADLFQIATLAPMRMMAGWMGLA